MTMEAKIKIMLSVDAGDGVEIKVPVNAKISLPRSFGSNLAYELANILDTSINLTIRDAVEQGLRSVDYDRLITEGEAALMMGISREALRDWDKKGITRPVWFRPYEWTDPKEMQKAKRRTLKRYIKGELLSMWKVEKEARKQQKEL